MKHNAGMKWVKEKKQIWMKYSNAHRFIAQAR